MLSESSLALLLATLRVLCNEHYITGDKVDILAKRLISANEQVLVEKIIPVLAKLAIEDDQPGKLFATVEEILMALTLFSENLSGPKLEALS